MAENTHNTKGTGAANALAILLEADRRLVTLRYLQAEGPLSINTLRAVLRDYGHPADVATIVGDLAWLERRGLVKIADDGLMVEAVEATAALAAPVPKLTEAVNERDHDPGYERDKGKGDGRETA